LFDLKVMKPLQKKYMTALLLLQQKM